MYGKGIFQQTLQSRARASPPTSHDPFKIKSSELARSLFKNTNASQNTQPTSNDLFQSPGKTRQQELEEKILFLRNKTNNDRSLPSSREQSPDMRTVSGITEQQSTTGNSHEQCNRLIEEQNKRIKQLEDQVLIQNGKLEHKDNELIQLRSQDSGLEAQYLQIELTEVKVRLEERDRQLFQMTVQLKEWSDTANRLINSKADFEQWKTQFQQRSAANSTVSSPHHSPNFKQNDSEEDIPVIDIDCCKLKSNDSKVHTKPMMPLHLQGLRFVPTQVHARGDSIEGEVYNIDEVLEYTAQAQSKRLKALHEESKDQVFVNQQTLGQLTNLGQMIRDELFKCVRCQKEFSCEVGWQEHKTKTAHTTAEVFSLSQKLVIRTVGGDPNLMTRNDAVEADKKALKKLFTGKTLGKRSVSSSNGSTSTKSKYLKKRNKKDKGKKNPVLVSCRKEALKRMVDYLSKVKGRIVTVQEINTLLFSLFKKENQLKLKSLDTIFCDGLYFPRTSLTRDTEQVRQLFEEFDLVAKSIKNSAKDDYWFVKLCEDSTPEWCEMKLRLLNLMRKLREKLSRNVHLYQLDRTKDFGGYFVCNDPTRFAKDFADLDLHKSSSAYYKSFSTCLHLEQSHTNPLDRRSKIVDRRIKIYNKTISPLFAPESVFKKIGMGSSAFFHCSNKFYQRHRKSEKTGRLRIEESNYISSVDQEEQFLCSDQDPVIDNMVKVIEQKGSDYVRLIPFEIVWNTFWDQVKEHFFLFEDRKTAIIYFHNIETGDFIGPLYDNGPRFKKDDCKKRYSICGKQAVVNNCGHISTFVKQTNLHQFPIPPLNVSHDRNKHYFKLKHWNYDVNVDDIYLDEQQLRTTEEDVKDEDEGKEQLIIEKENILKKRAMKEGRKKKFILINKEPYLHKQFWFIKQEGSKSTSAFVYSTDQGETLKKKGDQYYVSL